MVKFTIPLYGTKEPQELQMATKKSKRVHPKELEKLIHLLQRLYHGKDVEVTKQNRIVYCKGTFPDTQTIHNAINHIVEFAKAHSLRETVKKIQGLSMHLELSL